MPRSVELPAQLRDSLAVVVQGVRRSGKSTLLTQMLRTYRLDPRHCAFLNFEDLRLGTDIGADLLERFVQAFRDTSPRRKRSYFFFDEVQNVTGWQRWLRIQLERPSGNYFFITGSNAELLSGELGTLLTGRYQKIVLFPFSFEEFRRLSPRGSLEDYLELGGFPEPLALEDGDRLRLQYFLDIVERDIRERVGARSSAPIKQLVQMIFEASGSELSLRRIASATGIATDTAATYVDACESAYLLFSCPFFAFSARKRSVRNKKYYPIDPGLRRMVVTTTGVDRGKALECAVFIALLRLGVDVSYWRGDGEIDFVVNAGNGIIPIQVSYGAPLERHHQALERFYEAFPFAQEAIFVGPQEFRAGLPSVRSALERVPVPP